MTSAQNGEAAVPEGKYGGDKRQRTHIGGPVEAWARRSNDGIVRVFLRMRFFMGGQVNLSFKPSTLSSMLDALNAALRDAGALDEPTSESGGRD